METLLASLAQALYPNPKDDYEDWQKVSVKYTYARGATEVVKQFLEIMRQQEEIYHKLLEKVETPDVQDHRVGA